MYKYIYFQLDSFAFDTCAKKKKLYKKQTEYKNPIKLCEKLMND